MASPEFDQFAGNYDAALDRGISLSGENKNFFIERRVEWTKRCLGEKQESRIKNQEGLRVMDYGCGTGSAFGKLREAFGAREVVGVDVSTAELAIAAGDKKAAGLALKEAQPELMRGVSKGVVKSGAASRKMSRLSARIKKLAA